MAVLVVLVDGSNWKSDDNCTLDRLDEAAELAGLTSMAALSASEADRAAKDNIVSDGLHLCKLRSAVEGRKDDRASRYVEIFMSFWRHERLL